MNTVVKKNLYEYADKRALHMISEGYVGNDNGNYGSNNEFSVSFNTSHKDALPTKTVKVSNVTYCMYCSRVARVLQKGLEKKTYSGNYTYSEKNYDVTGHTCICKGAMDEIELQKKKEEIKSKIKQFNKECAQQIDELDNAHDKLNPSSAEELVQRIVLGAEFKNLKTINELLEFTNKLSRN